MSLKGRACLLAAAAALTAPMATPLAAADAGSRAISTSSVENGRIAFVAGHDIFTMRPDGSGLRQLTHNDRSGSPAWAPGGRRLLYGYPAGTDAPDNIWVMDRDGRHKRRVIGHPSFDWDPAWAPSGRAFVFASSRGGGGFQLYVYSFRTGRVRQVTDQADFEAFGPVWSPDGRRIAFSGLAAGVGALDLYTIRPSGRGLRQLTATPGWSDVESDWSPSGERIVYGRISRRSGAVQIMVARSSGADPRRIRRYDCCAPAGSPTWSPDGRWIAATGVEAFRPDGSRAHFIRRGSLPDWGIKPTP